MSQSEYIPNVPPNPTMEQLRQHQEALGLYVLQSCDFHYPVIKALVDACKVSELLAILAWLGASVSAIRPDGAWTYLAEEFASIIKPVAEHDVARLRAENPDKLNVFPMVGLVSEDKGRPNFTDCFKPLEGTIAHPEARKIFSDILAPSPSTALN